MDKKINDLTDCKILATFSVIENFKITQKQRNV